MANILFYCALFIFSVSFQESNAAYNVITFGAKPDGKTDSTQGFVRAWSSACKSVGPATVYVPKGSYLVKPIVFSGPCKNKILFTIAGKIVAPSNYWSFGKSGFWILFYKVSGVTINGGIIDGKGAAFWACKNGGKVCPPGTRSLSFVGSNNSVVSGLTSINSQMFHISVDESRNIILQNLKIIAPSSSPNTDGIHIQSSTGIIIRTSTFRTGDDCISLGPGSTNISIQKIACGPGHGISIGSLAEQSEEEGVQNVTVTSVVFKATQNGVRIKSWGRPSTGFVKNIIFRNIVLKNAYNPIIIDQKYCPSGNNCPNQDSGVKISGVTYKDIKGISASKIAMNFICSESNPCNGLKLQNINVTYLSRGTATSSCSNAHGTSSGIVIPKTCF
ncbi:polygalacturonase-like [Mercurialis annua]|uniref:polygalacturonase-like n=1 Tax=Mercurialis annua TaxID=3986 RepID=UPI0024AE3646|nr:polygalacturonase-like [Mercurialis annua]